MIEFSKYVFNDINCLTIIGRIDGMTAKVLESEFNIFIETGNRTIIADLSQVNFISSLGLRVFLLIHQKLKQAGGELILIKPNEDVIAVLKMGGFDRILKIYANENEISFNIEKDDKIKIEIKESDYKGKKLKFIEKSKSNGDLQVIGDNDKLHNSTYSNEDVVAVNANKIKYGLGLATTGEEYNNFKEYFGEALVINNSMFYYPAIKHSAVDMMEYSNSRQDMKYNFLNGVSFDGEFNYIFSLNANLEYFTMIDVCDAVHQIINAKAYAIVFMAESKGIYGMNLKKVPISENSEDNINIFDLNSFSDWFNFPLEPHDAHHIIAGCGIIVKEDSKIHEKYKQVLPQESNCHIHSAVFGKGILNMDLDNFENEIKKINTYFEINKVIHLLPNSRFSNFIAGIIVLE